MGEIAEMMLEGLLDEQTGEYIGDINEGIYGDPAPGFPISYEGGNPSHERAFDKGVDKDIEKALADCEPVTLDLPKGIKVICPECGRRIKAVGYWQHHADVHDFDIPW